MTSKKSSRPVRPPLPIDSRPPCPDHAPFLCTRTEPEQTTRTLGLVVLRGPTITLLSPVDGHEEIANPFLAQE